MDPSAQVACLSLGSAASLEYRGRTETISLKDGLTLGDGPRPNSKALHFGAKTQVEIPTNGNDDFSADKAFSIATWILSPENDDNFVIASQMNPEDKDRGWLIELGARVPMLRLTGDEGKVDFRPRRTFAAVEAWNLESLGGYLRRQPRAGWHESLPEWQAGSGAGKRDRHGAEGRDSHGQAPAFGK